MSIHKHFYTCPIMFQIISILVVTLSAVSGQRRCYSCTQKERTRDCETISVCSPGEQCMTDRYLSVEGHPFYSMGCRPSQICKILEGLGKRSEIVRDKRRLIHLCQRCCDGDYCNKDLCPSAPSTSPPVPQRTCYSCGDVTASSKCENTIACQPDEMCYSEEFLNDSGEFRVKVGCQSRTVCTTLLHAAHLLGRRANIKTLCSACCNKDFCNLTACKSLPGALVTGHH